MNTAGAIAPTSSEFATAEIEDLVTLVAADFPFVASADTESIEADEVQSEEERRLLAFSNLIHRPIPFWKRVSDLVLGSVLLIGLSPILLLIAAFIRLTSRGPVLFRQVRLGEMGENFVIYKFRTLHPQSVASENHRKYVFDLVSSDQAAAKPDLSSRMIRGGHWLRSTSLDELPQLLNILKGEMSLIGPRPEVLRWDDYEPWQLRRFEVRPGVTGLWQVTGKNKLTFHQMIQKDIQYVAQRSLRLDAWILFKTLFMMLKRENH